MIKSTAQFEESKNYSAGRSTCVVFFLIWAILAGPFLAVIIKRPGIPGLLSGSVELIVLGFFLFLWISRFKLSFGNHVVKYRSLFGSICLNVRDIESFNFGMTRFLLKDALLPPVRFELFLRSEHNSKRIVINAKVFSRECNKKFLEYLEHHGIQRRK